MVDLSNVIMEEALTSKKRNALDNSKFALVYRYFWMGKCS